MTSQLDSVSTAPVSQEALLIFPKLKLWPQTSVH